MQRSRRYQPLSSQPLILVLCQLRFSPVRQMNRYTPAIQDAFRRTGFPIERAGKVRQVTFTPSGSAPVQMVEQQRWEYRNREETWSVLVTQDSVILQTTAYTRFERFAERLQSAVNTVLTESEEYRTRSSSLDDTSCTSRAEARRGGGGGGGGGGGAPHSDDSDHQFRHADHRFRRIPITLEESGGP